METPSSTRRVTRSQTSIARKSEESEKATLSRQRNGRSDRSALIDITNDSPIVGLALQSSHATPSSLAKKRDRPMQTPGSGEALLRGQVKTLLQKVEEEAELSKFSFENHLLHLHNVVSSPSGLLPTPANTPQVPNLSSNDDMDALSASFTLSESDISQSVTGMDGKNEEAAESHKTVVTRSLLFDFSDNSETSDYSDCSSVLTYQDESGGRGKPIDEDDASVWSIQVNASPQDDDEDDDIINEDDKEEDYEEEEEGEEEVGTYSIDELCEGLRKMNVNQKKMPGFTGKHTRFIYNSDDEIEGEEVAEMKSLSPGIVRLKGMPTPEGKHLRFLEEEY
ncbi:PREDICTED: DNA polymerase epsilon catalytic subunit A-like [Nelumbo nucifera]|uniref:Uncharacterized protein n=2 Tax=Nelumbo nucifera TaxID=4432 RepID=A0A822XYA6_NELNU|nr:PREDICTED: DNA polymerase epsilon catalytic subunit A-like [Nelumbo nucifera]DAD22378.1 TPA_asm: hypothetical protein HUJ06_023841 [Nelumbo nucifera]